MITVPMTVAADTAEIRMSVAAAYYVNGEIYDGPYTFTPTKAGQTALTEGKRLEQDITIQAIPDNYIDTTDANATADDIRAGKSGYVDGAKIMGALIVPDVSQDGITKILTII